MTMNSGSNSSRCRLFRGELVLNTCCFEARYADKKQGGCWRTKWHVADAGSSGPFFVNLKHVVHWHSGINIYILSLDRRGPCEGKFGCNAAIGVTILGESNPIWSFLPFLVCRKQPKKMQGMLVPRVPFCFWVTYKLSECNLVWVICLQIEGAFWKISNTQKKSGVRIAKVMRIHFPPTMRVKAWHRPFGTTRITYTSPSTNLPSVFS